MENLAVLSENQILTGFYHKSLLLPSDQIQNTKLDSSLHHVTHAIDINKHIPPKNQDQCLLK